MKRLLENPIDAFSGFIFREDCSPFPDLYFVRMFTPNFRPLDTPKMDIGVRIQISCFEYFPFNLDWRDWREVLKK